MKKIISLLLIVLFAATAYPTIAQAADDSFPTGRVTAKGDEPNGDGQPVQRAVNQSGVTYLGNRPSQLRTCINCQTSGKLTLTVGDRRANPGTIQRKGAGGNTGGSSSSGAESTSR